MIPSPTKNANKSFTPPEGWQPEQDGDCGTLSVRLETIGRRVYHYSTWKPTPEELDKIARGAPVILLCVGVQPPVALDVGDVP